MLNYCYFTSWFLNCKVRSSGSYNTITEINNTGNPKDSIFIKGKHASLYAIPTSEITFCDFPGREQVERKKPTNVIAWAAQKGASPDDTALVGQLSLEDKNTAFPYGTITFPDGTVWTRIWDSYGVLIQGWAEKTFGYNTTTCWTWQWDNIMMIWICVNI